MDKYAKAIEDKGYETTFMTGYRGEAWSKAQELSMKLEEKRRGLRLYVLDGWKKYSRNSVYHTRLVYLAGVIKGNYWVVRCPGTVTTIDEALEYMAPAAVKKARKEGRKVLQCGCVYKVWNRAKTVYKTITAKSVGTPPEIIYNN